MLRDESCNFLVFDFDNHDDKSKIDDFANTDDEWIDEVNAMRSICQLNNADVLVERSRSGKGAHSWLFFEEPIPAATARKFGTALLTKGAESVNQKSFKSYDRMIPAQDHMPEGGLGNLIALPLQGQALKSGNSAFIDENWNAYPDQWKVLKSTSKISKAYIDEKIGEWSADSLLGMLAEDMSGSVEKSDNSMSKPCEKKKKNFELADVDGTLEITMANQIYIDIGNIKPRLQNQIRRLADFSNPEYYKNQAMGFGTRGTARMQFGPIRYRYTAKDRAKEQGIEHFVYPRFTRLVHPDGETIKINDAYKLARESEIRNKQIVADVSICLENGRTPLVLTKFKEHAAVLFDMLKDRADHIYLLQGGKRAKERDLIRQQMKEVPENETIILVAIGQYIGEGFNYPRLDTMMLTTPIAWEGNVEQYAGRLHRDFEGKQEVIIYDYVDSHIRVLEKMYHKRLRAYKKIGYEICMALIDKQQSANAIYDNKSYQEIYLKDLLMVG